MRSFECPDSQPFLKELDIRGELDSTRVYHSTVLKIYCTEAIQILHIAVGNPSVTYFGVSGSSGKIRK